MFKPLEYKVTVTVPSTRQIAKETGVGHATVARFIKGDDVKVTTAKALLPYLKECPCCGKINNK